MSTLEAIQAEHSKRGQVLPRHQYIALSALGTKGLRAELKRLEAHRVKYTEAAQETPTSCAEMGDPHWCIEAALVAHVPEYVNEAQSLDPYLRSVLKETLNAGAFLERFELDLRPDAYIRGDEGDAGILDYIEDSDGRERGDLVGIAFWDRGPEGYAEIHVSKSASALIALHEISHLLHYDGGHGQEWRTAFRALTVDRYGADAGTAFDEAINHPDTCLHGSARNTGDNQ